jgi:hypothetical protein
MIVFLCYSVFYTGMGKVELQYWNLFADYYIVKQLLKKICYFNRFSSSSAGKSNILLHISD